MKHSFIGYVVRLKNDELQLSKEKPSYFTYNGDLLLSEPENNSFLINKNWFPDLKWGDEPIKIKLTFNK